MKDFRGQFKQTWQFACTLAGWLMVAWLMAGWRSIIKNIQDGLVEGMEAPVTWDLKRVSTASPGNKPTLKLAQEGIITWELVAIASSLDITPSKDKCKRGSATRNPVTGMTSQGGARRDWNNQGLSGRM